MRTRLKKCVRIFLGAYAPWGRLGFQHALNQNNKEMNQITYTKHIMIHNKHVKRLKNNNNKKHKRIRIEEEGVDHGKYPHLLLTTLTVMLFLTRSLGWNRLPQLCVWKDELNNLIRVGWMTLVVCLQARTN